MHHAVTLSPRLAFHSQRAVYFFSNTCMLQIACFEVHASQCNADLEKLSDTTLIFFHVLHVKAFMEIARIGTDHSGSQCDIQTKVPHQMSQINRPYTAIAQSKTSSRPKCLIK